MSRSCADENNIRQHRSRLLQLAEGSGKSASVSSKRRSYSSHHALFKSLQQMTPSPRIATKLLSLEEVVRNDPGYTPNIEHLVFPARKNSNPGSNIPVLSSKAGKQSARSRLAEVFALNKHQQSRNKASNQQQSPVSNSATPSENSRSQTESNRSSQRKSIKEGSGGVEPVAEDSSSTPAVPDGSTTSQCSAVSEELDNMASRGPNVSILHLRSTSEPWETGPSMTYSNTSSTRSGRTTVTMTSGSKYAGRSNGRREPATNSGLAVGSSVSGDCSRELSPVRWCDREVDGVYLGRSGWVQVQQRSLDENRRIHFPTSKQQSSGACSPSAPPRIKMSDYHCSKSEPGKFPEVLRLDETNQQRPGYLPLPNDNRRTKDKISPSSLDLAHEDPMTPPPVTPIISPPPAFQDTNRRFLNTSTAPRPRSISSKPPFLSRSNAVEVSPPPSPPPAIPWATLPTQRISPGTNPMIRPRRLTPSPISTPQQHSIPQTKSLEDTTGNRRSIFQKYDSSSSSSSSFGFRSLDSNLSGRGIGMPRLTETDSSLGGYEDGDEDDNLSSSLNLSGYSSVTVVNSSPDTAALHSVIPSGERVSPSSLRQGRQHHRQMRRSPGSDGSNKKLGSNNCSPSSSSSSSSSRSPSAAPFRRSASHNNPRQLHHQRENSATWDGRNNRVRRSRSLQLPERRSPSAASCTSRTEQVHNNDHQYYHSKVEPTRVVVKINGEQPRPKRHVMQQRQSEDIQRDREREREEELRREAEEEARVVTEFLYGARSRDAARALIIQRCLERSTTPQDPSGMFNVFFVNNNRGTSRSTNQQRPRMLQRGATTPALGSKSSSPVGNNVFCPNPCNPTTCDFWPHCAHRDGIYTTTKASTPTVMSPVPPSTLRLSQSYPNNANNKDRKTKRENGRNGYQSTRSSPASLERVNEHDISPNRHYPKRGNSLNVPSPTADVDWRNVGPQCRQHSHLPMREKPQGGQHPIGLKVGLSDTSSSTGSSMDVVEPDRYRRDDSVYRGGVLVSCAVSPDPSKVSPIEVNSVIVNTGGSSASSTSSDIWVTTSDRTMTKSPRNQKSSGASTPLEDAIALSKSPVKESDEDNSRPGSAPAQQEDRRFLDTQQRSLSLPKSFQAGREAVQHRQSGLFPWSRRIDPPRSTMHSPAPTLRPPTPETARTAPATPVREMGLETDRQPNGSISSGLAKTSRFSSTPLLDPPNTEWEINRPWPQAQKDHQRLPDKDISQSQRNISGNSAESVLQKFRKSFSLRFYKKGGGNSKDEEEETEQLPPDSPPRNHTPPPLVKEDSLEKFRFGPLVWRTSKERKKGKKAARNAKCNSGDSGIQIEMVGRTGGDSSESHDTDHLADDEPLDETDSPPVIRRRGTTSSSDGKPSRPTSDVINQILIDKLKADLQARSIPRRGGHQHVRRTHSDLGGQRLFNWDVRNSYRRMFSSPSPIKMKPHLSPRKTALDTPLRNSKRFSNRPQQLRRSISQPLGINELSPLLRRKPSAGGRSHVLSEDERGATSDDEMMSDSESSVASLTDRKKSFEQAMDEEVVILAEAVWDHVAMETEELAFRAGDVIEVLDTLDRDWWWGARGDQSGWFPSAFVRLRVSQEDTVEDCLAAMASGGSKQLRRRTSISLLSNDQVRSRVVRELINTERDFVKVLRDVAEGYLAECRRRTDMFSDEQIETIFGNLEQLLEFQSQFLEDLERNVEWDAPHRSCIGDTFLLHQGGFRMYSEYCNSHPMAIATLQELYQHNNYSKFFEACRLMRGLIEIPLDGYLLTPVQRICKYPLQLAELLKYSKPDHPDHEKITKALEAMRGVAVLINERKRRMESLEKLAAWQQRVEGWEGEDLIETSSQLIYQGEAVRVTSGMWTNNIILFLFDHQLIYCKKDILKRNTYVYKGRIQMDTSEVINLTDGKEPQLGVSVRHGIKIYSCVRDKWLLFCCRTAQEKSRWLESFAQERRMVAQDLRDGLEFAPAARHLARMAAARCYRRPPSKPRSKNYKRGNSDVTVTDGAGIGSNGLNNAPVHISSHHSLGRRMGTWFTFGSNKKGRGLGRAATLQTVVHPS